MRKWFAAGIFGSLIACSGLLDGRPAWEGPRRDPVWTAPLFADGDPVLSGNRVFVAAHGTDNVRRLFALDLASGAEQWKTTEPIEAVLWVSGTEVVASLPNGEIHAYDGANGGLVPMTTTAPNTAITDGVRRFEVLEGPSKSTSQTVKNPDGSTTTSFIDGLDEHTLSAVNLTHGSVAWSVPIHGAGLGIPYPMTVDGSILIVRTWTHVGEDLYRGYDTASGGVQWEAVPQGGSRQHGYSKYDSGQIVVPDKRIHSLLNEGGDYVPDSDLSVIEATTGKELWHTRMFEQSDIGPPAVGNGWLVAATWPHRWNGTTSDGTLGIHAWQWP